MANRNRAMNPILQPKPEAAGCVSRAVCRQRQAAPRERLPSPEDRLKLRLRLQEHLALLENARETAQVGRALGLPWNVLWPAGQRPGDRAGLILGATVAGRTWDLRTLVRFSPGLRWECPRRCKRLSCRMNRNVDLPLLSSSMLSRDSQQEREYQPLQALLWPNSTCTPSPKHSPARCRLWV